jgi:23S rRNA pseudouridine1911/1915/1917 synthase
MENTLLRLVQKQTPNANPVHRLGRATTGIVLFAKHHGGNQIIR